MSSSRRKDTGRPGNGGKYDHTVGGRSTALLDGPADQHRVEETLDLGGGFLMVSCRGCGQSFISDTVAGGVGADGNCPHCEHEEIAVRDGLSMSAALERAKDLNAPALVDPRDLGWDGIEDSTGNCGDVSVDREFTKRFTWVLAPTDPEMRLAVTADATTYVTAHLVDEEGNLDQKIDSDDLHAVTATGGPGLLDTYLTPKEEALAEAWEAAWRVHAARSEPPQPTEAEKDTMDLLTAYGEKILSTMPGVWNSATNSHDDAETDRLWAALAYAKDSYSFEDHQELYEAINAAGGLARSRVRFTLERQYLYSLRPVNDSRRAPRPGEGWTADGALGDALGEDYAYDQGDSETTSRVFTNLEFARDAAKKAAESEQAYMFGDIEACAHGLGATFS